MAVYVDDSMIPLTRKHPRFGERVLKMSHMVADSTEELLSMAEAIGIDQKWIQSAGTYREHFDVCATKRKKAIELGAEQVSKKKLASIIRARRRLDG